MKKTIIIIIATAIVTALLTTVLIVMLPKSDIPEIPVETAEVVEPEEEKIVYQYIVDEPFITNMKDSKRFIKASFLLEVSNEEDVKKLTTVSYIIKDTIIKIMRNTPEEDYIKEDIQETLRVVIKDELALVLETDSIEEVFFLEFVMQ